MLVLIAAFPYVDMLQELFGAKVHRVGGTIDRPKTTLRCSPGDGHFYRVIAVSVPLNYRIVGKAREAQQAFAEKWLYCCRQRQLQ